MTQRQEVSKYFWENGTNRLVQSQVAANISFVKTPYLQSAVKWGIPISTCAPNNHLPREETKKRRRNIGPDAGAAVPAADGLGDGEQRGDMEVGGILERDVTGDGQSWAASWGRNLEHLLGLCLQQWADDVPVSVQGKTGRGKGVQHGDGVGKRTGSPHRNAPAVRGLQDMWAQTSRGHLEPRGEGKVEEATTSWARSARESVNEGRRGTRRIYVRPKKSENPQNPNQTNQSIKVIFVWWARPSESASSPVKWATKSSSQNKTPKPQTHK